MSAEVLTELVVKLGFITDEKEKKNFQASVGKIEKGLTSLAKSAVFAGVALAGMAVTTANNMGKIERSARNMGTSAKNLRAFTNAFEELGLGGQTASGIIDNLNSKLTGVNAQGFKKAIKDAFGVNVEDANSQLRDTADILQDIFSSKKGSRLQRQNVLQQWLGIDEKTFKQLESGELLRRIEEQKRRVDTVFPNYKQASEQALEAKRAFEGLTDTLSLFGQKNFITIAPELTKIFRALTSGVEVVAQVVNDVAKPAFGWIADFLESMGHKVRASGAQTAGGKMLAFLMPENVIKQDPLNDLREKLDNGEITQEQYDHYKNMLKRPEPKPYVADNRTGLKLGERNNNPGNIRGENGFRRFNTPFEGLQALSYQLGRYGNVGNDTVEKIISKWAPPNENNTKAYIAAVSKTLGVRANERLNMNDPQVIEALMHAIIRHENGRNIYDPRMIAQASYLGARTTDKFGKDAWKLTQNVNIHTTINGADDPVKTGKEVGKQVGRTINDSNPLQRVESARLQSPLGFGGD